MATVTPVYSQSKDWSNYPNWFGHYYTDDEGAKKRSIAIELTFNNTNSISIPLSYGILPTINNRGPLIGYFKKEPAISSWPEFRLYTAYYYSNNGVITNNTTKIQSLLDFNDNTILAPSVFSNFWNGEANNSEYYILGGQTITVNTSKRLIALNNNTDFMFVFVPNEQRSSQYYSPLAETTTINITFPTGLTGKYTFYFIAPEILTGSWNGSYTNTFNTFVSSSIQLDSNTFTYDLPNQRSVSYNANGGNSTPDTQVGDIGTTITLANAIEHDSGTQTGYKVTFNPNGGTVSPTSSTPTREIGYDFNGWHLNSTAGTTYSAAINYTITSSNVTMYAGWTTAIADQGSVTLPTTAQCTRTNYSLLGWSTSSASTSVPTSMKPGKTYSPTKAITLYAIWQSNNTYRLQFDDNLPSWFPYTINNIPSDITTSTSKVTIPNTTPNTTFQTFVNWNTKADGTGTSYSPNTTAPTLSSSSITTLYANWNPRISTNVNGVIKPVYAVYTNVNGTMKTVSTVSVNVNNALKTITTG